MSKIPTPAEVGLPDFIDSWRPNQAEALTAIQASTKRVKSLGAPTGFGKSPVLVAAAIMSNRPTCIVTMTKGLQDQYMRDYSSIGMVDIRGRANYRCDLRPDYTCEDGYAASCPYKGSVACPSSQAEMRAAVSSLVVTNYAKWCSAKKFGRGMDHFEQVILDEGHDSFNALADAMQVVLHHREIEQDLKLDFPPYTDCENIHKWREWASTARDVAFNEMSSARASILGCASPAPGLVRYFTHMRNLTRRLNILATCQPQNWVVDTTTDGYQFDPIRPGMYAEYALLMRVPSVIIASATLRPKSMYMIGIGKDKFDFFEYPSEFDPKRCPIYYVPTMRVDKNATAEDLRYLWIKHDQIAARRRDRKSIVHTISYARREGILQCSRYSSNMIVNERGEPASETVEEFFAAPPGTILVSPSVGTGYDFKMDRAEWQFICKIPFLDGRSKIIKARQADDPEYGPHCAMQSLVQMCGRIMREKGDRGETFLCDDHLTWFLPRYSHLAPKSFHGFFKLTNIAPPPPPKL